MKAPDWPVGWWEDSTAILQSVPDAIQLVTFHGQHPSRGFLRFPHLIDPVWVSDTVGQPLGTSYGYHGA